MAVMCYRIRPLFGDPEGAIHTLGNYHALEISESQRKDEGLAVALQMVYEGHARGDVDSFGATASTKSRTTPWLALIRKARRVAILLCVSCANFSIALYGSIVQTQ